MKVKAATITEGGGAVTGTFGGPEDIMKDCLYLIYAYSLETRKV